MKKPNITEGKWVVKEWTGDEWPNKRISIGQKEGRQFCVAISPRYAEREQVLNDFKLIKEAPNMLNVLIDIWQSVNPKIGNIMGKKAVNGKGMPSDEAIFKMKKVLERVGVEL